MKCNVTDSIVVCRNGGLNKLLIPTILPQVFESIDLYLNFLCPSLRSHPYVPSYQGKPLHSFTYGCNIPFFVGQNRAVKSLQQQSVLFLPQLFQQGVTSDMVILLTFYFCSSKMLQKVTPRRATS